MRSWEPVWKNLILPIAIILEITMISSILILGQADGGSETLIDAKLGEPLYKEKFKVIGEQNMMIDGKNEV